METKTRKRAPRACNLCRSRKVRCILANPSDPCINCQHTGKYCTYNRREGVRDADSTTTLSPPTSLPSAPDLPSPSRRPKKRLSTQRRNNGHDYSHEITSQANQDTSTNPTSLANDSFPTFSFNDNLAPYAAPKTCHPDYSFLQTPDTKNLLPQDLAFLTSQGCFVVPRRAALDEFMRQYFMHVHPMLPILDEGDHWMSYNSMDGEGDGKMSMLVLQGILFISSGFVSLDTIKTLGFRTLQEAKFAFYRRAKLLYDFSCEQSPIATAQAALLLAHSHLIPLCLAGNKPLGSIWLGIAIHYARAAKAHCYYSQKTNSPADLPRVKKLHSTLKRLWWCCIVCDRLLPLTSRQNIKITKTNFNFSGCSPLGSADLADESYNSDVYDSTTKLLLAEILAKLVQLCVILTDVLTMTSVLHNNPSWVLSRKMLGTNQASLCKMELERWYRSWTEVRATIDERMAEEESDQSPATSVALFTNLLEMYYHSARLSLCHYQILHSSLTAPNQSSIEAFKQSDELQGATSRVVECIAELGRLRLTRWLPMTAIGCTAFPLALHLIDLELRPKNRETSTCQTVVVSVQQKQQQLNILLETMSTYRPRYYIADWVMKTVRHVVGLARQWSSERLMPMDMTDPTLASWKNMLQTEPSHYLRLAMTMDLSISHGKLPEENDFPPSLRHGFRMEEPQTLRGVMSLSLGGYSMLDQPTDMTSTVSRVTELEEDEPISGRFAEDLTDLNDTLDESQDFTEAVEQVLSTNDASLSNNMKTNDNALVNTSGIGNCQGEESFSILDAMTNGPDGLGNMFGVGQDQTVFKDFLGELNGWLDVEQRDRNKIVIGMDVDGLDL